MKKNGELSLEQLRQKLHISKRKAAWMLQHKIIKCKIQKTKTFTRYCIRLEDVNEYLQNSQKERLCDIPVGIFSSKEKRKRATDKKSYIGVNMCLTDEERTRLKELIEKRLYIYPDAMDIDRAAEIVGYNRSTILRHVQKGHIFSVMINDEYILSKESLAEFFASDRALRIMNKTEWHEKVLIYYLKCENEI